MHDKIIRVQEANRKGFALILRLFRGIERGVRKYVERMSDEKAHKKLKT
jgi:ribosome-associated translation inhibitor RaiA